VESHPGVVLLVEDDPDAAAELEALLDLEGYSVVVERSGGGALTAVHDVLPDLVLLDLGLPDLDGLDVCQRLRRDPRWDSLSILALTGRAGSENEVLGLQNGLDGYLEKPWRADELLARVGAVLRQSRRQRGTNPLTLLPGNSAIESALVSRLSSGEDFAVCYLDIDNFKAYNDRYGFAAGDDAILGLADAIRRALDAIGSHGFQGHVGGDDFIVLIDPAEVEQFCTRACASFDDVVASAYTSVDLARGTVEVEDRTGAVRQVPIMSLSAAVVLQQRQRFVHVGEISRAAAELKTHLKRRGGGTFIVDRRRLTAGSGRAVLPRQEHPLEDRRGA
jgi:diguanylate cyclase (GGDEF)-like protein